MKEIGLYIHIPFCAGKCAYCDFYSVTAGQSLMDDYLDALLKSIEAWKNRLGEVRAKTLYIGGGTPVLFGAERLCRVIERVQSCFDLRDGEATLEANPNSTTADDLVQLKRSGFNRISFGVQSANDDELKLLTRRHSAQCAEAAIENAKKAGFCNISADLMLGIPNQTLQSLDYSVDFLAGAGVSHVSAYMLKIEENTPFGKNPPAVPDEDETCELYLRCVDRLAGCGYGQYEISNFAKAGSECAHNIIYWNDDEYLGIGPAAHSFIGGVRFGYRRDLAGFIKGVLPEQLDTGGDLEEYLMLRLRLAEGLVFASCTARFPNSDLTKLKSRAAALEKAGLCRLTEKSVSLTPKGFLLSNACTAKLIFG